MKTIGIIGLATAYRFAQRMPGRAQLNMRVPADIAPGVVPMTLEADGVRSPRTESVAVR